MDDKIRRDALQMSRDLTRMIEQQQAQEKHTDLIDCLPLVAVCVWDAAYRQARGDKAADPALSAQVERVLSGDFLKNALRRHNWRNVSAVLSAFRDAGLAGTADVAAFYTHVNHIPEAGKTS